jgi:outer membrane protein assembly factor BamB
VIRGAASGAALAAAIAAACTQLPDAQDPWSFKATNDVGLPVLGFRWKQVVNDRSLDHKPQEFASPATAASGDVVYVGSHGGDFCALDAASGKPIWRRAIGSVSSKALVDRGRIFVGTDDGALLSLDTFDGAQKWRYQTKGAILHEPVAVGELIVFATDADHVVAVERATGKWRWQYDRETPEEFTLRGHAGVGAGAGQVYVGFADGFLVALTGERGEAVWVRSLRGKAEHFVDVDATPVYANGVVYAASSAGGLYGLDARDGAEKWRAAIEGVNAIAADEERVYAAAADEGLHALDLAGHVLWRQGTYHAGDPGRPRIFGDYLIFNTAETGLYVVDKTSGELVQSFNPGAGIAAEPEITPDGRLYTLSNGGIVYAFNVREF